MGTKEATKIPFLDEQPLEDIKGSKLPLLYFTKKKYFFRVFLPPLDPSHGHKLAPTAISIENISYYIFVALFEKF